MRFDVGHEGNCSNTCAVAGRRRVMTTMVAAGTALTGLPNHE
jgi:hypothetical protein